MRRISVALVAAGVLVAGALVASTVMSDTASAQTTSDTDVTERRAERREMHDLIRGFLEDDVISGDELAQLPEDHPMRDEDGPFADALADGQITKDELDAVHQERKDARAERREERRAHLEQIRAYLDDDVIDSSELAELGDDHPFNDPDGKFADAAADGQITREELDELRPERRPHRGWHGASEGSTDTARETGLNA